MCAGPVDVAGRLARLSPACAGVHPPGAIAVGVEPLRLLCMLWHTHHVQAAGAGWRCGCASGSGVCFGLLVFSRGAGNIQLEWSFTLCCGVCVVILAPWGGPTQC
jgi:hypothetical protein